LANALAGTGEVHLSVAGQEPLLALLEPKANSLALPSGRRSMRTLVSIVQAIFTRRSTVLHYQGINLVTLFLLAIAGRIGWRVVFTPHNVQTHFRNRIYNAIKWPLWRSFNMIILHTKAELDRVPEDLRPRVAIIPHGEYAPGTTSSAASEPITRAVADLGDYILAPGFIRDDKNLDYLVENADLFTRYEFSLVVAGRNQSSLPDAKIAAAATYFDGFLPDTDLEHLIAHASAVILPYDKVSESGILHQALSVGTPVIASDIPGFKERLRENENGWFLEGLTPQALDSALGKIKSADIDRAELANRHREAYSWSAIASALLEELDARRLRHQ